MRNTVEEFQGYNNMIISLSMRVGSRQSSTLYFEPLYSLAGFSFQHPTKFYFGCPSLRVSIFNIQHNFWLPFSSGLNFQHSTKFIFGCPSLKKKKSFCMKVRDDVEEVPPLFEPFYLLTKISRELCPCPRRARFVFCPLLVLYDII